MSRNSVNIGVYLAALVALADQISKNMFVSATQDIQPFIVINRYLNFRLSWNKGVTFGMFNDFGPWMPYVLVAVAVAILLLLLNWLRKSTRLMEALGLGFIIGGAVGNIIDRLRFGAVIDFIDVHYQDYHWYTFNLADSAIVLGVGLLLLENFLLSRK